MTLEAAVTKESPRGLLLTYRVTGHRLEGEIRYWLDADRGYAATRVNYDALNVHSENVDAQSTHVGDRYAMRNFQRSPKGLWYPTLVIREIAREPKAPGQERVFEPTVSTSFLLDFHTEMPDSLFTKQGGIRTRTSRCINPAVNC